MAKLNPTVFASNISIFDGENYGLAIANTPVWI